MLKTLVGLLVLALVSPISSAQNWSSEPARPSISVSGEAVVLVVPDRVVARFGVEHRHASLKTAKEQANAVLSAAIDSIKTYGVPESGIQIDQLSLEPSYTINTYKDVTQVEYFEARVDFTVTLTNPSQLEGVVTRALEAGVRYIHAVDFETTELKKHREQARDMAVRAALEKAQKLVAPLGQTIGPAISISEGSTGLPWYYGSWYGRERSRDRGSMVQSVMYAPEPSNPESQPADAMGKIAVRASVSITFSLN